MDVFSAISNRRSIRAYSDKPIEDEKLNRVLEAGRLAPSAKNRQDWKFVVVKDPEIRHKLALAARGQRFVGQAPVVLVGCGTEPTYVMPCGQPAYSVDVSIAFSFMMLEATELGLGTCWLGAFDEEEVKKILGVPPEARVVAMMPLGYSAEGIGDVVGDKLKRAIATGAYRKPMEEFAASDRF